MFKINYSMKGNREQALLGKEKRERRKEQILSFSLTSPQYPVPNPQSPIPLNKI
jgi:hypothetical protein